MSDQDETPSPDATSEHPQAQLRDTMAQIDEILAREARGGPMARCATVLNLTRANPGTAIPVHADLLRALVRDLLRMPLEELAQLRAVTAEWTLPGDPTT